MTPTVVERVRALPGMRPLARAVLPSRRRDTAQWRRIERAVPSAPVRSGPFAGMVLGTAPTGSHIPKRLGCYEAELHPLVESWRDYRTVVDLGCGEGWYVVGLARRLPGARVLGFDSSAAARSACLAAAAANGVRAEISGEVTRDELAVVLAGAQPPVLLIVDVEGAETELLDSATVGAADLLVETHDFASPGATDMVQRRLPDRVGTVLRQQPRRPADFADLAGLSAADAARAVDESRHPDQSWVWLPGG